MANIPATAKKPADHALKQEARGNDREVTLKSVDLTVTIPAELVDSYEASNAAYSGFTLPIIQEMGESGQAILEAATEDGKIRQSKVQRYLLEALNLAVQGN